MSRKIGTPLSLFLVLSILSGCAARSRQNQQGERSITAPAIEYLQDSTDAIQTLQTWYTPSTGLYQTTGWWNSANAITVLADYARVSRSTKYNSVFANTFTSAQKSHPAFLNNFYDDEGWWALAWIDAYDVTHEDQYLSMAESIFADMAESWDNTCGGGIWWSKDKRYKNAIANELFLSVAAHLANRASRSTRTGYSNWSRREWAWFQASGMINSKNLVNDGLAEGRGQAAGGNCVNNGRTIWSYNQGVVVGGLAEMSVGKRNPSMAQAAQKIAMAATTLLVDSNGILHDPCEPKCGADGTQFKGVLIRNLALLDRVHPQAAYRSFIDANADSIWKNDQGPGFQLGQVWSGPFNGSDASIQSSALDALLGAAAPQIRE